jgi:hypothetical protein
MSFDARDGPQGQYGYRTPPPYGHPPAAPNRPYQYPEGAWPGFGLQPARTARVAPAWLGWLLLAVAVAIVGGAFLPWVSVLGFSVDGTRGDGRITMGTGLLLGLAGVLIGLHRGRLWVPSLGFALGLLVTITAVVDMGQGASLAGVPGAAASIGPGLYLTLGAGVAALVLAVVGILWRA